MAPQLCADAKGAIEASLRHDAAQPNWKFIAAAHNTTEWTVREICRKMRERAYFGATIRRDTIGRPRATTQQMEESIIYMLARTPWLYQRDR